MSKCPWCKEGNVPNDRGDHWIVKSIIPSRIVIKRCLDLPARASQPEGEQDA